MMPNDRALLSRGEAWPEHARSTDGALAGWLLREGPLAELQAIYDMAPQGLCLLDREFRWVRINARMAAYNGIPAAEHIGHTIRELLPEIADAAEAVLRGVIETGEPVGGVEIPAGGGRVWLATCQPLFDETGQVIAIAVMTRDQAARRAAVEQTDRLLQMIEHSRDFIAVADLDGYISYMNRGGRRMIGLAEDADLSGLRFYDYVAPTSRDLFETVVIPTARERGLWEGEMQLVNLSSGAVVDVQRSTFSLRRPDGSMSGFATVTRDITVSKATIWALAEREALFKLFIEKAPASIAMLDTEFRYIAASRRYIQDYGVSEVGGLIGRSHYELMPDLPERWRAIHPRVLAGETFAAEDDPFPRRDGSTDWLRWEMTPWHRADGTIGGALLFSEMVTARKEAELVLARDRAALERMVEERTGELQRTQAALAQAEKLTALGQLAGGVAHDLNNVLQAAQAAAELIQRRAEEPVAVNRLAELILDATGRGTSVTERMLMFARRSRLLVEPIHAAELLAGLCAFLAQTLGAGIDVRLDVAPGLPSFLADRGRLETVLINLGSNARDAMPGGGAVTVAAALALLAEDWEPDAGAVVLLSALKAGRYVRLSVSDDGCGMSREVLARVTEPFFTTKPVGKGTGLGLAMARGFAEQSGGALAIESVEGRGTIVSIWLPAAGESSA